MSVADARYGSSTALDPMTVRERVARLALLIVDDVCLYREGLAAILARQSDVRCVHTAPDLQTAIGMLQAQPPDLVLINLSTPGRCDLLRAARATPNAPRVIVLGVAGTDDEVIACAEAGVDGYLLRSQPLEHLIDLMRSVVAGETLCTPRVTAVLLRRVAALAAERRPAGRVPVLTGREDQVLALLNLGLSNLEIAGRLGIEVRTVKNHVHHILEKVGARRRGEAVAAFAQLRLTVAGPA